MSVRAFLAAASLAATVVPVSAEPASDCGVDVDRYSQPSTAYLCDALRTIEEQALAVGMVDWPQIKRQVLAETRDARSESDVHSAIAEWTSLSLRASRVSANT